MTKRLWVFVLLLPLMSGVAAAQDAKAVVQAAAKAMGTDTLKCITYSGGAPGNYVVFVGQGYSPAQDWPKVELVKFSRNINFDTPSMREEQVRRQGNNPARGGGGIPIQGEQQIVSLVSGTTAWNMNGTNVVPQPGAGPVRQLEIYLDPHGFLKGAMMAKDLVVFDRFEPAAGGEPRWMVSYMVGKFRVQGSIDKATNRVQRIQTFVPNPLLGDMVEEKVYSSYKQFGSVWFPVGFHNHTNWDHEGRPQGFIGTPDGGHNSLGLTISNVQPNVCGDPITVPEAAQKATIPPVRAEGQKVADGVYYITGGSHHSVAVEFSDFVTVIEGPLNEARSLAVIAEVKRLIPNKRIKYIVNTHHHFDHSGGLRTFVHEGAYLVAHRDLVPYYYYTVLDLSRWTLEPDRMSLYPPDELQETYIIEEVQNDKYTISDGNRILDLYLVGGEGGPNPHAQGMLMAYLPRERILVEADLFTPPAAGQPFPATLNPAAMSLYNSVQAHKLNVDQVLPLHGRQFSWADFAKAAAASSKTN